MAENLCGHFKDKSFWVDQGVRDKGDGTGIAYRVCRLCGTKQTKVLRKNTNAKQTAWIGVRRKMGYAGEAQA